MKILYTATLTHIGYEFDQVPLVDLVLDDGKFDVAMVLNSCNVTPTTLSLYYRAKSPLSKFAGGLIDMRQVIIRLYGSDTAQPIQACDMIKKWMSSASAMMKRREALPFELDDYPVISVLKVVPSTRQGRFKHVQRPVTKIVSEVIHDGCMYLQFGTTYERIFRDTIGDYMMVKYMCARKYDGTDMKAKDLAKHEESLLHDFSAEGPLVIENPASLIILGDASAPLPKSLIPEADSAPATLTVGMTLEDWYHHDHLVSLVDHLDNSRSNEESSPPLTWRRNAHRAANE